MNENELLNEMSELLEGTAAKWFRTNKHNQVFENFGDFVIRFLQDFEPYYRVDSKLERLKKRLQTTEENVVAFFAHMENEFLMMPFRPSEAEQVRIIRRNLLPHYIKALSRDKFNSVVELKTACQEIELSAEIIKYREENNGDININRYGSAKYFRQSNSIIPQTGQYNRPTANQIPAPYSPINHSRPPTLQVPQVGIQNIGNRLQSSNPQLAIQMQQMVPRSLQPQPQPSSSTPSTRNQINSNHQNPMNSNNWRQNPNNNIQNWRQNRVPQTPANNRVNELSFSEESFVKETPVNSTQLQPLVSPFGHLNFDYTQPSGPSPTETINGLLETGYPILSDQPTPPSFHCITDNDSGNSLQSTNAGLIDLPN